MDVIAWLAERRIREAMEAGAFDDLEGMGRPIRLDEDDDPFVPPELRLAYRILKRGGYIPPEVQLRKEIHSLAELLACAAEDERPVLARRLQALVARLAMQRPDRPAHLDEAYLARLNERFTR